MNPLVAMRMKMRDRVLRFYTHDLVKISRKRRARQLLGFKTEHLTPLSAEQRDEILSFWKPFRDMTSEMKWFEFYNGLCQDKTKLKYYIPESVYYTDIDTFFTIPRRCEELDDKNMYDLFFGDVKMPRTIVRKTNGVLLDRDYQIITAAQALALCKAQGRVISKEARMSGGGFGVKFFDFSSCSDNEFLDWLAKAREINIQEIIKQHDCLNQLHANSINSIRIMSMMLDGEARLLSSVLRMGRDGSQVDNASSGGIACGILKDGHLREFACDKTGERLTRHPQGAVFKEIKLVGYDKCCELVRKLAGRMSSASHLLSWDFAIDPEGDPVLIEVNLTFGGVTIHQMCNGPIFGELTETLLDKVYHSNSK